jgi:hypothetical protein
VLLWANGFAFVITRNLSIKGSFNEGGDDVGLS